MRKLKLQTQLSLDSFICGPNGEMDWLVWNWDEELMNYVKALTEPVDCILLGRVLAEGFIPAWAERASNPETAEPGATKMNETPKVVFSKTLETSQWENVTLATGDLVEEVTKLKNQPGQDLIAYGGGRFVSDLIKHGLIDDYHLFINPTAIGSGMPIFKEVDQKLNLKLVKASPFSCGIVVLQYQPA
ncbi:dihydrofolate reductase family protein [Larkinella terrae]|uniref:Dihydrofolate reductase n=1 Tax=Larkinella terrae TaxID=2025311 RepID=A0A7K0EUP6_9BACT|nr:dihydrofolate reductase family protein [Larkinella terrae]MRS65479.1 dihydrofolate reductase [Larkinella terrae]